VVTDVPLWVPDDGGLSLPLSKTILRGRAGRGAWWRTLTQLEQGISANHGESKQNWTSPWISKG